MVMVAPSSGQPSHGLAIIMKNSWYKTLVYIFMAQLVTANPKLFSKSTDQELSESVVKVSGNSKFTRLDVREQCIRY